MGMPLGCPDGGFRLGPECVGGAILTVLAILSFCLQEFPLYKGKWKRFGSWCRSAAMAAIEHCRGVGMVSLVLTLATFLSGPDYFPYFILCAYLALIIWGFDVVFLELKNGSVGARIVVSMMFVCLILVGTFGFVIVKLPIGTSVQGFNTEHYLPGTQIAGIPWRNAFYELWLYVSNNTDHDYDSIDLVVRPDRPIAAIGKANGFCHADFEEAVQLTEHAELRRSSGQRINIPMTLVASDGGYRIRCDKLPARSRFEVVMAIANVNEPPAPVPMKNILPTDILHYSSDHAINWWFVPKFGDAIPDSVYIRTIPTSVRLCGSYVALQRKKTFSEELKVSDLIESTTQR